MRPTVVMGYVLVPLLGVFMCVGPVVTRPVLQFGVRVPPGFRSAPVVRRERRSYRRRSAVIAICAAAALVAWGGYRSWVPSRLILLSELTADVVCFWWSHRRIAKVKADEGWFAGRRQVVVADTSWRTEPPVFPVRWLQPAAGVIVATIVVGVLRYPHLPDYLSSGGRRVATSPVSAFAVVVAQVYVTGVWTALLVLVYRSRPDLDAADPAESLRTYRKALGVFARAGLVLLACVDLTLLLAALRVWQVFRLSGGDDALVVVPVAAGLVVFFCAVVRAGVVRARTSEGPGETDRDDDRFWKGGIVYVNRDDPALLVGARVNFGWTVNFGNPAGWLLVAGFLALPAGLVALGLGVGI